MDIINLFIVFHLTLFFPILFLSLFTTLCFTYSLCNWILLSYVWFTEKIWREIISYVFSKGWEMKYSFLIFSNPGKVTMKYHFISFYMFGLYRNVLGNHFPLAFPCAGQSFPIHGHIKHKKVIDFPSSNLISHKPNRA